MGYVRRARSALAFPVALAVLLATAVLPGAATARQTSATDTALQAAAAVRLLANAGFEAGTTTLAPWSFDGAVTVVTSPVHSGAMAARVVDTSPDTGVSLRSAPMAVVPGEELTATAWMSRTSGTGGSLYLEFWKADGARASATSVSAAATSGWQQLTVRGVAPDDGVTATVLAYSTWAEVGTTVWDDAAVSALPPPLRRVPNAGFEQLRNLNTPTEWSVLAPGGSATFLKGAGTAHSGRGAVRTVDNSSGAEVSVLSRQIPVSVGETITASVWANPTAGSAGTLYLEFRNAAGTRLGTPPTVNVGGGTGWRQRAVSGTAPSGTAWLTIRLYSTQPATGTTVWDDVYLRSSADTSYEPTVAPASSVLFIGDQRIESYTGVSRVMRPGTKAGVDGSVFSGSGGGTWDANPRLSGTVLRGGPGYQMWYVTTTGAGYAESVDGVTWSRGGRTSTVSPRGTHGVVANPAWTPGGSQPKFFMMRNQTSTDTQRNHYHMEQSNDGITWVAVPGSQPITGWDVSNVSWDPVTRKFIAMTKQVPVNYAPPAVAPGPRTVWVSTSTDFKTWTAPRPSFSADLRDDELIPPGSGRLGTVPWTETYGMPAIRYGDQYLGLPWLFDIVYSPYRDNADPGPDKGRSHIGIAASRDLVNWSRPDRAALITPGARGSWDYGFNMSGTTMDTVQLPNGQWETRYWYSSFSGEHVCSSADVTAGTCTVPSGNSRIGLVTWPTDRFQSFRAAPGGGSITTRPLTSTGSTLRVNYDPGSAGGTLKVEALDLNGVPIPGYTLADAIAVSSNALAPGTAVAWANQTALPAGQYRLRFTLTAGDLYSFALH